MEFSVAWFDDASRAWRENKRRLPSGAFRYTCDYQYKSGRRCGRNVYRGKEGEEGMCKQHRALFNIGKLLVFF